VEQEWISGLNFGRGKIKKYSTEMNNKTQDQTVATLESLITRLDSLTNVAKNYEFRDLNGKEGFIEGIKSSVEMVKLTLKIEQERASLGL
jgi:hypothetical protein